MHNPNKITICDLKGEPQFHSKAIYITFNTIEPEIKVPPFNIKVQFNKIIKER